MLDTHRRVAKAAEPELRPVQSKPTRKPPVLAKRLEKDQKGGGPSKDTGLRKADVFTERVTLQISPEMRDEVDALARDLQRAKTTKDERITANTVMRVAVQLLMEKYRFEKGDVANTEEELFRLVVQRLKSK